MKIIKITRQKIVLVDDEDYDHLNQFKWYLHKNRHVEYAARGNNVKIQMHRSIMGLVLGDGKIVDHINGDGLDNRRENLRIVSPSINKYNCRMKSTNTSGFRGVAWHKRDQRWRANICVKGKQIHCGQFLDKILAAKAYDKAALKFYGNDAVLNFPTVLQRKGGDFMGRGKPKPC